MNAIERNSPLVARIFMSTIFLISGYGKLTGYAGQVDNLAAMGVPMAGFLIICAVVFEIGGGGLLLLGFKARIAAAALIVFTVLATLMFHAFWTFDEPQRTAEMINFLKNLSIMGGLLMVVGFGSGAYSIDRRMQVR